MLENYNVPYSFQELVDEISELTGIDRKVVEQRVWLEALLAGYNTFQDAIKRRLNFHIYNVEMEFFYKESDAFIFETMVEFCRPLKQKVINDVKDRIGKYLANCKSQKAKILMFGDGSGSDTMFLYSFYKDRADFFYFDVPGSKTFEFFQKRVKKHSLSVRVITNYEEIPKNFFDVIVSLEVLEHLPDPEKAIKDWTSFVKNEGIILVTESFGAVEFQFPTHLKSNLKYEGKTPFMFLKHNSLLTYYSKFPLFRPMEFTKKNKVTLKDKLRLFFFKEILKIYVIFRLKRFAMRFLQ